MSVVEELREAIGEGELVLVESDGDAARMLAEGSVRAYVSFMLPYRNAQMTAFVPGLAIADQRNTEGGSLRIAIHKSQPMLAQIMTKAIDALTPAELASLRDRWLVPKPSRDAGASLRGELSAKELAWLDAHPVVRLGDDFAWPPFTFMDDDDNFAGIASGYAAAISGRLGIELRPVRNLSWPEVIEQVKTGDLDVLPAVARTKMREAFLNFTQPYVSFPVVIATRKDAPLVDRLDDLEGWTVGVVEGYVTDELLAENHSGLNRKRVTSVAEGLRALEDNEITAFVGNLGAITYEIERARLEDIRIAAPTDYRVELSFGVRKDWPELVALLDKALDSIDERERSAIRNTWMALKVSFGLDVQTILKWALPIGAVALGIVIFVIVWNQRLAREVAERKEAEAELAEKEAQLRIAMDNMPGGMFMVDENLVVQVHNQQYQEMYDFPDGVVRIGASLEEALRVRAERGDYGPGDPEELVEQRMLSYFERMTLRNEERLPNGRIIELLRRPVEGSGVVGIATDITERKLAESALAKNEAHLRLALDIMTDGLFVIDPDMHFSLFNDRYRDLMGLGEEVLYVGASVRELCLHIAKQGAWGEGDPEELADSRVAALANDEVTISETVTNDGRILETRKAPRKGGGCVGVVSDITERKRAEEALHEARDAAEAATKAKATFLATMSHEIRTPMGGVIGMVDLLQQSKMTDDQRQMIDTVRDSAHSLLTIINDILDFSKIEAGKLDLEEIPISIRDIVEGAGEALAVNARNKDIGLSVYVDPDIPDALVGDQVRLRQILFNFGSNAIKFTEQGKVLIRADTVPSPTTKEVTVRFQVIDEGIGIPEDAQKKLFQAFSQVEASTTRRFGGTGLGLSICQRLTEMMNGEIGVDSVPGEGSSFSATISFPVAEEHTIKSDGHDLAGLNVLFATGDDDMRELLPRYLEHWGATVTAIAETGDVKPLALKAAEAGTPFNVIGLGSGWPLSEQINLVESLATEEALSSAQYVIACQGRVKGDRKEMDGTIYVDANPLRRGSLIKSVAVAAGRASPEVEHDDSEVTLDAGKAPTVAEAEAMGQLILLAEDNVTNQDHSPPAHHAGLRPGSRQRRQGSPRPVGVPVFRDPIDRLPHAQRGRVRTYGDHQEIRERQGRPLPDCCDYSKCHEGRNRSLFRFRHGRLSSQTAGNDKAQGYAAKMVVGTGNHGAGGRRRRGADSGTGGRNGGPWRRSG